VKDGCGDGCADGCGCADACGCGCADACGCAEDVVEQAKGLIADGLDAVKSGDLEGAKDALAQLNGMKDQLGADLQKEIDKLASAIKAKEAAGAVKLPGR
jgi:hypothetical protein